MDWDNLVPADNTEVDGGLARLVAQVNLYAYLSNGKADAPVTSPGQSAALASGTNAWRQDYLAFHRAKE